MEKEQLFIDTVYKNKGYFYRIAKRILQSEADIEDAIQEMVIRGYRSINGLKEDRYIRTWLTRILLNQCKTILKKQKQTIYIVENLESDSSIDYHGMEIRDYMNQLQHDLKVIANLYYFEDLPLKEIAEIVNIPIGTVKSRLAKVRSDLKLMMKE